MNKYLLLICLTVLTVFICSCAPHNGEVEEQPVMPFDYQLDLEIWANRMPNYSGEVKVIANYNGNINFDGQYQQLKIIGAGVNSLEGTPLSTMTLDTLPVYMNPGRGLNFSIRGVADFSQAIPSNSEVIGWMIIYLDGVKYEIYSQPALIKDVY